jgi:GT2 family glycosyltransferase
MSFARGRISDARARELMLEDAWHHDVPRRVDWAVGAALLIRRDAIDAIGGLDERFFMYVEDVEWCWRARTLGWEIWFEPSAVVRHIGNASGEQRYGERRTRAYMVNTYRFYRREHGALSTAVYRSLNVIGCGWRYVLARARGDGQQTQYWRTMLRANLAINDAESPQ